MSGLTGIRGSPSRLSASATPAEVSIANWQSRDPVDNYQIGRCGSVTDFGQLFVNAG
jgi:hypothetical protein